MDDADSRSPALVVLLGPPSVGKMTAGQELERLTGFRLFHSHQIFDLVTNYFTWNTSACHRLVMSYRTQFSIESVRSGLSIITTDAWDFNQPLVRTVPPPYMQPYLAYGRVYCVELTAPLEVLLARNQTENRRAKKKTDWSTNVYLRQFIPAHRWDSGGDFPFGLPSLRLDTEHLTAADTARRICEHFRLA